MQKPRTVSEILSVRAIQQRDEPLYIHLEQGERPLAPISYYMLRQRAVQLAAHLVTVSQPGDRVLLLFPGTPDFMVALFACFYAGLIAVPAPPLNKRRVRRTLPRMLAMVKNAQPTHIIASPQMAEDARALFSIAPELAALAWIPLAGAPDQWSFSLPRVDEAALVQVAPDDIAYLQYTSGSTSDPKGVAVTHANLMAGGKLMGKALELTPDDIAVTWLPNFHDMGLVNGLLQPLYTGYCSYIMDPVEFVQRPARWLEALTRFRATFSGAPNMGYELLLKRVSDREIEGLELSCVRNLYNAAEPIRPGISEEIHRRYGPVGLPPDALSNSYGLAEATLMVTAHGPQRISRIRELVIDEQLFSRERRAEVAAPGRRSKVMPSSGPPLTSVTVVDPERRERCAEGIEGEVWVSGPMLAAGYYRNAEASEEIFQATLANGEGPFMRTGDLAFMVDGQLYVSGRAKDVIIVAGANYYPQDIELTVARAHRAARAGCGAAFSVDSSSVGSSSVGSGSVGSGSVGSGSVGSGSVGSGSVGSGSVGSGHGEALVVVTEIGKRFLPTGKHPADLDEVVAAIIEAVSSEHELPIEGVMLIHPGAMFKTSSGKIQRQKVRAAWLDGGMDELVRWQRGRVGPVRNEVPTTSLSHGGATVASSSRRSADERRSAVKRRSADETVLWLQRAVANTMGVKQAGNIGLDEPFQRLGLTSLSGVALSTELGEWLGRTLPATLLWAYPTIRKLVDFLSNVPSGAAPRQQASARDGAVLVAVVGIGCRFPGADGKDKYWRLLKNGVDAIVEVPKGRFDVAALYDADPTAPGKLNTRFGGFLERPDEFDAGFFGISPREAACMDPQQRVLLEVAWDAIDDAGLDVTRLSGSRTGVFVGATMFDYGHLQMSRPELVDGYMGTGTTLCILANRISYLYDLRGPSLVVDTACSSSLMSVHMACESLRNGEVSMALAGGVNLIFSPLMTINATKLNNMAADGRCKTFDARADGAVRSEGAGMVVLKPLERALADGDRIYAVIRATASNQDGRSNGLMAPNPEAQRDVLTEAYQRAGIAPWQVQYVEAHGTGTLLGDPIEARALGELLGEGRPPEARTTAVGSVKSNIGHTEAAAGIAGLIKVALSLYHQRLPASLHFEKPNPHIPFDQLPLRVVTECEPWLDTAPRYAGVSAFGWGGTNAHAVLSGPPKMPAPPPETAADEDAAASPRPALLLISARSKSALRALAQAYRDKLSATDGWPALARAAAVRRTHHPFRLAAVGHSRDEVAAALDPWLADEEGEALEGLVPPAGGERKLVFVYPGSGWQWRGMARELMRSSAVFNNAMKRCDQALASHLSTPASEQLFLAGDWFERTATVQPVLFAVQVALTVLWRHWGVKPAAVLGHSMGEPAAAWACGALTLEQAASVAVKRAAQLQKLSGKGGMALVELTAAEAQQLVAGQPDKLAVAVNNSPRQTVIAGELAALADMLAQLEADGVFCRRIKADGAGHCHYVEPLAAALKEELGGLGRTGKNHIPYYSPVTGGCVAGTELDAAYWARNLRETVRFSEATRRVLDDGYDGFIEMSAHPVLCGAINRNVAAAGRQALVLASGRRDQDMRHTTLAAAGQLYTAGHPFDYAKLYPAAAPVELPRYPWQRQRYWFDDGAPEVGRSRVGGHLWLASHVKYAHVEGVHLWPLAIASSLSPWLCDHALHNTPLVPGVSLLQLAAAAFQEVNEDAAQATVLGFKNVVFEQPLTVPEGGASYGQLVMEQRFDDTHQFMVYIASDASWSLCARGELMLHDHHDHHDREVEPARLSIDAVEARCQQNVKAEEFYQTLRNSGVNYGPAFRGLSSLRIGAGEALGALVGEQTVGGERRFDVCLHTAMAVVGDGAMPVAIERVRLWGDLAQVSWSHAQLREDGRVDVLCCDARGGVLLQVDGLEMRLLARREDALAGALYATQWLSADGPEEVAEANKDGAGANGTNGHESHPKVTVEATKRVLLVGGRSAEVNALRMALEQTHAEVAMVPLADFAADPAKALAGAFVGGCEVLAYCGALDCEEDKLAEAQRLSMGHVVRLVQALVASNWRQHPRLYLVTRGAVAVGETSPENPPLTSVAAAPCWGLARTIRHEHAELRCSCIDMGHAPDAASNTAEELLRDDGEMEVAYDAAGGRWFMRLLPHQPSPRRLARPAKESPHSIVNHTPGALDGLGLARAQAQPLAAGQILIETRAAALNFRDVMKALAVDIGAEEADAHALGDECAGVIIGMAAEVTGFAIGDEVIAVAPRALSSQVRADARLVVAKPAGLTWEQAAALPIAMLTAHLALTELARIREGERVLIHSAAGGVGLAAVHLCLQRGAIVFATAGNQDKRDMLEALGVEATFHSRTHDWAEEVRDATGGDGVDVVLNSLAGVAIELGLSLLRPGGRFLEIGRRDIAADRPLGMAALKQNIALFGVDLLNIIEQQPARIGAWLKQICAQLGDGAALPLPVRSFGLTEMEDAFRVMARGEHIGKLVLRFAEAVDVPVMQPAIVADVSYLISGGLGGIGRALASRLVANGARHLALMSRSEPSEAVAKELAELSRQGVEVRLLRADVSSAEQVRGALESMADMPPLAGVFHAAVSLADSTLLHMTDEQIAHVSEAKISGAYQLHRATLDKALTHFCMFSSAAAVLGSPGQGNYAGANAYLDALAFARQAAGLAALSVSWGSWAEVGGAADAGHDKRLALRGMDALEPDRAFDILDRLLESRAPHVTVATMRWRHYFQSHPQLTDLPFFADVQHDDEPKAAAGGLRESWQTAATDAVRKAMMRTAVCGHISRVLKVPSRRLGDEVALSTLGFDSLTALELRNRLEADVGLQLSTTLVWSHPTIEALVTNLHNKLNETLMVEEVEETANEVAVEGISAPGPSMLSEAERRLEAKLNALEERMG